MTSDIRVRPATLADAEHIFALINLNRDQLIPRSMGNIVENIDRFLIAETDGTFAGCATYQIHPEFGEAQAATLEIQSVAVKSALRRRGIGRALIETVMNKVRPFSPREVLVITFAPEFFRKLGFSEVPKDKIMHKLYTGCINCTKHANPFTCPEIAMARSLN